MHSTRAMPDATNMIKAPSHAHVESVESMRSMTDDAVCARVLPSVPQKVPHVLETHRVMSRR